MLSKKKIAFVGAGAMAEAMIGGLVRKQLSVPEDITASAPREERCKFLFEKYRVKSFISNAEAIKDANVVVLCVKPQRLGIVLEGLKGLIPKDSLVLSIIAGATLDKIMRGLEHKYVVRSMPNTPSRIGEGVTVWTESSEVTDEQRQMTKALLGALGEEVHVHDENYCSMATALSGTGPAYVYLFMEAMIDAGVHLGFARQDSELLVTQTLKGSIDYFLAVRAESPNIHVAALRSQVTSPGGTSAEALYYLEKAGFRTAISRAVWAAYQRTLELGKEKQGHINVPNEGKPE
jgi:pyrroline-5-carboxylate reductase